MIKKTRTIAAVCLMLICAPVLQHARAADLGAVPVPDVLQVPADQTLLLSARGDGVQIYACLPLNDNPTSYAWTFKAPEATLRDDSGKYLGKHYAGPTWEALDGSKIVAEVTSKSDSPSAAAIPWLLLRVAANSGPGIFNDVVSVQRLNTEGGKSPATGCSRAHAGQEVSVAYGAIYRFYRLATRRDVARKVAATTKKAGC